MQLVHPVILTTQHPQFVNLSVRQTNSILKSIWLVFAKLDCIESMLSAVNVNLMKFMTQAFKNVLANANCLKFTLRNLADVSVLLDIT